MRFQVFILLSAYFFSSSIAQSQTNSAPTSDLTALPPQINEDTFTQKQKRQLKNKFCFVNYAPLDLLIPSKIGATCGWINQEEKSWELEYMRGQFAVPFLIRDLGSLSDSRLTLIRRSFLGRESFHFSYGLSYLSIHLKIGDALLNRISGAYPNYDILEIQSLGLYWGLGHRWIWRRGLTVNIDWLSWTQPIFQMKRNGAYLDYATNESDREAVEDAVRIISYFPRLSVLKAQLGISF